MSYDISQPSQFKTAVSKIAGDFLSEMLPPERVKEAAGRLALALRQAAAGNNDIYQCDPQSVAQAIAMSAMTGIMPGGPHPGVYLVPRRLKGKMQLQWQVSVRGLQFLAAQHGWLRITATPVHVDDEYDVTLGSEECILHKPGKRAAVTLDDLRAVYVVGQHQSGLRVVVDVPLDIIAKRRTKAQSDNIWSQWPIEMAQKTAIGYAIARGYFGALAQSEAFQHVAQMEQRAAQPAPSGAIEVDASSILDALPMTVEVEQ